MKAYFTMISELCVPKKQRRIKYRVCDTKIISRYFLGFYPYRLYFSECVALQDCPGQLTPKVFNILHFTVVIEMNLF